MTSKRTLSHILVLAAAIAAMLAIPAGAARAATVTWDILPGTVGEGDSAITGGTGTWDTTIGNWTIDGGLNNVAWGNTNNDTALFGDVAGTVTLGTGITVGGLQFDTAGYTISGAGPLTFGASGAITANADATISSVIAGSVNTVTLTKAGAGTLTLSGANTWGGSTTAGVGLVINAGTVQFSADNNLGNTANDITFGGGTLKLSGATGDITLNAGRALIFGGSTSTIEVADATRRLICNTAGQITVGTGGTLIKTGPGTLRINNHMVGLDGTIDVREGTLEAWGNYNNALGDGTNPATLSLNGGTVVLAHTGGLTYSARPRLDATSTIVSNRTNSGGGQTFTLQAFTVAGDHTLNVQGGSNVNSGTAAIVMGATTLQGSPTFNVTNPAAGGVTALTLGAVGQDATPRSITKTGNGLLVLSAANSYTGTTTVSGGVLRLGNATALPGGINATGGTSALTIDGGVVELGNANFLRDLGTGAAQFQITGGVSGFSAQGGARTVTVNDTAGQEIQWGSATFAPTILVLNETTANNTLTLSNKIDLNGETRTIAVNANTATISGVIRTSAGTAGLTKTGSGTLVLSGVNTYNGVTTVSGGLLRANDNAGLPGTGSAGGGSNLTINGGVFETGANLERAGGAGQDQMQITGGNSGFSANGGPVQVAFGTTTPNLLTWGTAPFQPGTFILNATTANNTIEFKNAIDLNTGTGGVTRTVQVDTNAATMSGNLTQSGTGAASFTKTGNGTLVLTGSNTYTGATTISGGALRADNNVGLPGTLSTGGGSYLKLAGGVYETSGSFTRVNSITAGAGNFQFSAANGGFSANGGKLTVTINNDAATEQIWGTAAANNAIWGTLKFGSATANAETEFQNKIDLGNGTRTVEVAAGLGGDFATISGVIRNSTGTGALTKTGTGTLVLSGNNTYNGLTTISAGTLQVSSGANLGTSTATDAVTLTGGTLRLVNDSPTNFAKNVKVVNANSYINVDRATSGSGNTHTLGTLLLSGDGRTLTVGGDNGCGLTFGAVTADNNAKIYNNAPGTLTLASVYESATSGKTLTIGGSGDTTIAGAITQNGANALALTKADAGTLTLSGTSTYTGTTTISAGKLIIGVANALPSVPVTVNGTLDLNGLDQQIRYVSGSGSVINSGGSQSVLTLNMLNSGKPTFSGAIDGNIRLVVQNATTLTNDADVQILTGTNTYTGGTVIDHGHLRVADEVKLGAVPTSFDPANITLINGGHFQNNDSHLVLSANRGIYLGSRVGDPETGGEFYVGWGKSMTVYGAVSGPGNLGKADSGTLYLYGVNTYTGDTTVSDGTLEIAGAGQLGSGDYAGAISIASGKTFRYNSSADQTLSGVVSGAGALAQTGAGTLTLSGANAYTGTTTVSAGTLRSGANSVLPDASAITVSGNAAGVTARLDLNGYDDTTGALTLGGSTTTSAAAITTGEGTLTLGGNVTYTSTNNPLGATIDGKLDLGTATRTFTVNDSTTAAVDLAVSAVISSSSGANGLTKANAGTMALTGANTYTGVTTVSGGMLRANDNAGLPGTGSTGGGSNLTITGGVFETGANLGRAGGTGQGEVQITGGTSGFSAYGAPVQVAFGTIASPEDLVWGAGSFQPGTFVLNAATANDAIEFKNAIDLGTSNRAVQVGANVATMSGILSGDGGGLTKTGAGTLLLSGINTYTGATTVSVGTLIAAAPASLPGYDTAGKVVFGGGTLGARVGGSGWTTAQVDTLLASAVKTSGVLGIDTTNGDLTQWTTFTGAGNFGGLGLAKLGTNTLTLDQANTHTGATTVSGGALKLSNQNAVQYSTLTMGGGSLAFDSSVVGNAFTLGGLAAASSGTGYDIALENNDDPSAAVALTVGGNNANTTYAGVLSGAGSLTKDGTGTLTLAAANTYAGATTIGAGTLELSGSGSILNTSGIALVAGGGLKLTNTAAETGSGRVADATAITSIGGTLTYNNTSGANVYAETIGSVALTCGQVNIVQSNSQIGQAGSQTLTLSGLTRTGASNTSAVTFSATGGLQASGNKNMINVSGASGPGAGQDLSGGVVIGPWATTGTAANLQTDYAVYDASGYVLPAGIAASTEDTWTTAGNAYTSSVSAVALSGNRTMAALRNTGATATITLSDGTTGYTLATNGILSAVNSKLLIAPGTAAGSVTAPGSAGGQIYINSGGSVVHSSNRYNNDILGNTAIEISAPINDNGGPVTLVKTGGNSVLYLTSAASNYSGGTVINAGILMVNADAALGAASGDITLNGGQLRSYGNATFNQNRDLIVGPAGGSLAPVGNVTMTFSGKLTGAGTLNMANTNGAAYRRAYFDSTENDFTGAIYIPSVETTVRVNSLVDTVGAGDIILYCGQSTNYCVFEYGAGAIAPLTLQYRSVQVVNGTGSTFSTATLRNNNATHAFTVETDLIAIGSTAKTLTLDAVSGPNNVFAGKITDGPGGGTVNLIKAGAGLWNLSGDNSYTGKTTVQQGTLSVNSIEDYGASSALGAPASGAIQLGAGSNSGTLEYTGSGDSTNRTFQIGNTTAGNAGGGTIDSSGSGALTFTAATFNNTIAGITATRTLTLGGDYDGGSNQIQGTIQDNNGTTGKLNLTKSGAGTWILAGASSYTGVTTISEGTLSLTGTLGSGGGTAITSAATFTQSATGVIAGASSLTVNAGTTTLAGTNTYTSATTVNGGTLILNYATNDSSKLSDSAALVLGGGTLELAGDGAGDPTEAVGSTTLTAGTASSVTRTSGSAVLRMGAITPNTGIVNFGLDNIASTSTPNTRGILGAWATVGGTDWATNSGTDDGGAVGNSLITAYTGYTDIDARGPSTILDGSATNVRMAGDGTSGNIDLELADTTVNTLLQSNADHAARIDTAGKTLRTGGIMIAGGKEAVTVGALAGDGVLTANTAGGSLYLINNNPARTLTVNAAIANNTSASALTTAGNVVLGGVNTYTGVTNVTGGTLEIGGAGQLGDGSYAANITISDGGEFKYNSSAAQTFTGTIAAGAGTLTIGGGNTVTISANGTPGTTNISGTGSLVLTGGTTLVTGPGGGSGNNAYSFTGEVWLKDGKLTCGQNTYGISNTAYAVKLGDSGTTGAMEVTRTNSGGTFARNFTVMNGGTGRFIVTAFDMGMTFSGSIGESGGAGNMIFTAASGTTVGSGKGILLSDSSTYTGTTLVNGGVLQIGTGGATGSIDGTSGVTNNAALAYNRSDAFTVAYPIGGTGTLTKLGSGTMTLAGINTYTGDTTVSAGALELADNAQLKFVIGDSGVNNKITGTATLSLAGDFLFDLTDASQTADDSWQIVDVATLAETYQSTFSVLGFTDAGSDVWTKAISSSKAWEFSEATGILKVIQTSVPGDTNGDKIVDAFDFITLKKNFGKSTGAGVSAGDFNGSGTVNWDDLNVLTNNVGAGGGTPLGGLGPAVTPEPATLGLLMVGALAVLRRRRK